VSDLVRWNPSVKGGKIRPQQKIVVKGAPATSKATSSVASKNSNPSQQKIIIHKVKAGETLWDLSKKYKVSIAQIKKWNGLKGDNLRLNQKIKIYAAGKTTNSKKVA